MPDTLTKSEKIQQIKDFFSKTKIDPAVTKLTLGKEYTHINSDLMKDASGKLLKIHKGEVEDDDRDNLLYSKFHGLEDHVVQHIQKDAGRIQAKAKMKMEQMKNLNWLGAGFFTPQLRSILVSNSLTQTVEGINPVEYHSLAHKITKMGEGAISDESAIPEESHMVNSSSFGFYDPMQQSEDARVGVNNFASHGTRKGFDNKLYKLVFDHRGNKVWKDHEELLRSNVEVPEY